jgi:RecA/RadA recombinase
MPRKRTTNVPTKATPKKKAKSKKKPVTRLEQLTAVAEQMPGWEPAHKVLTNVLSVPTIFPQFNVATGVNGWPLQRICLIHGPSNMGKTSFLHGLGLSFLQAGHFYNLVDAEFTTPEAWLVQLMHQWSKSPAFRALRPKSYESTVNTVRAALELLADSREHGHLPLDTTMLIGVDSIRKLNPERLMEMIAKEGAEGKKGSIDGMSGRAAQYKAALNAQWMDELTPLLYHANASMAFIGRESANPDKKRPFDRSWKLTGGTALYFDSSLVNRIVRAGWVKHGDKIIGERHLVEIHKTKVAGKEGKIISSFFHTSNGVDREPGFNRARDVLDMAVQAKTVRKKGSKYLWTSTGEEFPDGEANAVAHLHANLPTLAELERETLESFVPLEHDAPDDDGEDPMDGIVKTANG